MKIDRVEKNIFLTTLMETMSGAVVIQDYAGKILEVNSAATEILGVSKEKIIGMSLTDQTWLTFRESKGEILPTERPSAMTIKTGKGIREMHMGLQRADGEIRWINVNVSPIFQPESTNPAFIVSTFTDVTEEKKLVHELKRSESKFKAFFEQAPLGIVQLDPERRYLEANQAFQNMLGYSMDELRNTTMFALTHPDDLSTSKQTSEKFDAQNYSVRNLHKRYIAKNGKVVWGKVTSRSLDDVDENQKKHLVTIIEDITDQKTMEENLKATEVKLMESAKMSALGEMAAGMAHEINNPLSIISAYSAVIRKRISKEQPNVNLENVTEKLFQIEQTVERIAKIVRGLKTFSRNSDQDPKIQSLVSQIIQDTLILCQERFKANMIDVRVNMIDDPLFSCRPSQIIQVLMNLLNNSHDAIHAKDNSWIELSSKTEKNNLLLTITDSGHGITPAIQEKMMLPFFTTKEIGKGTGLGLSIAKGIIEAHQGKIYYDQSSKNTRFTIELPIL